MRAKFTIGGMLITAVCLQYAGAASQRSETTVLPRQLAQVQQTQHLLSLEGQVLQLERMSFAFSSYKIEGQFMFEYLRIKQENGHVLSLVHSGPSGLMVGDTLKCSYFPQKYVSYKELAEDEVVAADTGKRMPLYAVQEGAIACNGLIDD